MLQCTGRVGSTGKSWYISYTNTTACLNTYKHIQCPMRNVYAMYGTECALYTNMENGLDHNPVMVR